MPKLTKLFWLLTVISTFLISSSTFAQEEAVEPQVSPDSLDETSDAQEMPPRKYVELSIKGHLQRSDPHLYFHHASKPSAA